MDGLAAKIFAKINGKSEHEASQELADMGMTLRATEKNGRTLFSTCDYNANRVNVEILNDVVVKLIDIG